MLVARFQITTAQPQKSVLIGGFITKIRVLPSGLPSSNTVVIKSDGDVLTTLTDNTANKTLHPLVYRTDNTGAETSTADYDDCEKLSASLAGGDSDSIVDLEVFYYASR